MRIHDKQKAARAIELLLFQCESTCDKLGKEPEEIRFDIREANGHPLIKQIGWTVTINGNKYGAFIEAEV